MGLWATTVETARAGFSLSWGQDKAGAERAASAVSRVSVLRGMFLNVFMLRLMGYLKLIPHGFSKKMNIDPPLGNYPMMKCCA
jgi:hypothetical protein